MAVGGGLVDRFPGRSVEWDISYFSTTIIRLVTAWDRRQSTSMMEVHFAPRCGWDVQSLRELV